MLRTQCAVIFYEELFRNNIFTLQIRDFSHSDWVIKTYSIVFYIYTGNGFLYANENMF